MDEHMNKYPDQWYIGGQPKPDTEAERLFTTHTSAPAPACPTFKKLQHPTIHHKKCWTPYFNEMKSGRKKFDKRVWDTDYLEGDTLIQDEWNPDTGYTGNSIGHVITYILRGEFAEPGVCLMSVDGVEFEPREERERSIRDEAAKAAREDERERIAHILETIPLVKTHPNCTGVIYGYQLETCIRSLRSQQEAEQPAKAAEQHQQQEGVSER
jgi:hypothetical protein